MFCWDLTNILCWNTAEWKRNSWHLLTLLLLIYFKLPSLQMHHLQNLCAAFGVDRCRRRKSKNIRNHKQKPSYFLYIRLCKSKISWCESKVMRKRNILEETHTFLVSSTLPLSSSWERRKTTGEARKMLRLLRENWSKIRRQQIRLGLFQIGPSTR